MARVPPSNRTSPSMRARRSASSARGASDGGGSVLCLVGVASGMVTANGRLLLALGDAIALGVGSLELEAEPGAGTIGGELTAGRLGRAVEEHPLDPNVVVEVLEVPEAGGSAERVHGERGCTVAREVDLARVAQRSHAKHAGDPAAPGHVGLEAVDDVDPRQELGQRVAVLADGDVHPGRAVVAEQP